MSLNIVLYVNVLFCMSICLIPAETRLNLTVLLNLLLLTEI